jgi:transposase InsO family protein
VEAWEVARCLLKEIILWFGISVSIGLNNGSAFVAEVVLLMAKGLGITWKLHMAYCPQSLGKVECTSRILKMHLGKLCQESHQQWYQFIAHSITKD